VESLKTKHEAGLIGTHEYLQTEINANESVLYSKEISMP